MRSPRVRFTVRRLMAAVVFVALALWVYRQWWWYRLRLEHERFVSVYLHLASEDLRAIAICRDRIAKGEPYRPIFGPSQGSWQAEEAMWRDYYDSTSKRRPSISTGVIIIDLRSCGRTSTENVSHVLCLLETRFRWADPRTRIRERLSRSENPQNRVVSPEGLEASRLPSFARTWPSRSRRTKNNAKGRQSRNSMAGRRFGTLIPGWVNGRTFGLLVAG
jgi:hypothetical protein